MHPTRSWPRVRTALVSGCGRDRSFNAGLREVVEAQAVQLEVLQGQQRALSRRVGELERKAWMDSSNSGKPPSGDPVWDKSAGKKGTRRSLRERGARSPGKQPGAGSSTLELVDDPDERIWCPPRSCGGCGGDLSGEPVTAERRHQVAAGSSAARPNRAVEQLIAVVDCAWSSTSGHR